ncbi:MULTISPECIES: hypothetical protein [unclassified Sphingomonas]|uniref:hypothetical protein n=1 Tax=unclassified Sphingomonas TaxID=196159 RepID=UPI0028665039|nr:MULTISPECIES: hypothetical protein [unclassified Sphingomonas]MDR6114894.1 hypothetical protein [Sphingomonas sp. SORGH_AS_0789]MDR6151433.1 hypothetical protein [Sphingomonas sp. SORGH_AS_0742]
MLAVLQTYSKEIVTILGVFLTFGLNRFLKSRAKLIFGRRHAFISLIEEPLKDANGNVISARQTLRTESVMIRNDGREPAKNIEIVFNWKPQSLNVWPVRHYEERDSQNNRWSIKLDSLASGEELNLEVFSVNHDIPAILTIRSEDQLARMVEFELVRSLSSRVKSLLIAMMVLGLATLFYMLGILVQFLSASHG